MCDGVVSIDCTPTTLVKEMDSDEIEHICNGLKAGLLEHEWGFDAPGYIKNQCDRAPADTADRLRRELTATLFAWYMQWMLRNEPDFDI